MGCLSIIVHATQPTKEVNESMRKEHGIAGFDGHIELRGTYNPAAEPGNSDKQGGYR